MNAPKPPAWLTWPRVIAGAVGVALSGLAVFGFQVVSPQERTASLESGASDFRAFMQTEPARLDSATGGITIQLDAIQTTLGEIGYKGRRDDCRQRKIGQFGNTSAGKLRALEFCLDSVPRAQR